MKWLKVCAEILESRKIFRPTDMYSLSFFSLIAANLIKNHFLKTCKNPEHGELYLQDNHSKKLTIGPFLPISQVLNKTHHE